MKKYLLGFLLIAIFVVTMAFPVFSGDKITGKIVKMEISIQQSNGETVAVEVKDFKGVKTGDTVTVENGSVSESSARKSKPAAGGYGY